MLTLQDDDQINMDLQNALNSYYPPDTNSTGEYDEDLNDVVDFIQESLKCCGINSTEDWLNTPFYNETGGELPSSCCGRSDSEECPFDEAYGKVSVYELSYNEKFSLEV